MHSVVGPLAATKRACPRRARAGGTKKEERDRQVRGSLSKSPDCPLLLDVGRPSGGSAPVPGASEWRSLARVRRGVRKLLPQRRPPGGPNKDICCAAMRRPRQHARRCATAASGAGARDSCSSARSASAATKWSVRAWRSRRRIRQAAGTPRSAATGQPTTCSTAPSRVARRARAMRSAGRSSAADAAAKPGRSSDEAPPWQRGPAGRRSVRLV